MSRTSSRRAARAPGVEVSGPCCVLERFLDVDYLSDLRTTRRTETEGLDPGRGRRRAAGASYTRFVANAQIPSSHLDLLEAPIPVSIATVGPTGHPQVTAVWVVVDGGKVVTSLAGARQKLKNLADRPQATVFVIDPENPYRTLEVRGDVTIEPDPELTTLKRVLAAYGTDLASFAGPLEDRTTVTLHPTHVVAFG